MRSGGSAPQKSGGRPLVVMVQTAQVFDLDHAASLGRMNVSTIGGVHAQPLVRAPPMVVV